MPGAPQPDQSTKLDLKFTRTGRYLIAAGSEREDEQHCFVPVLYINVAGEKGWATHYPLDSKFTQGHDAAAAALHYGIQIISGQVQDVLLPDDPTRILS